MDNKVKELRMDIGRSLNDQSGKRVHALDGDIGHVSEFYFDDKSWSVRYLVIDTGKWLPGRKVLVSTIALDNLSFGSENVCVSITKEQIKNSPDIDTDMPVARQHEIALHQHYGWELYWGGESLLASPELLESATKHTVESVNKGGKPFNPHLRSTKVITGFHVHATDGNIGRIDDFIVETQTWIITNIVIGIRSFFYNRQVMISSESIDKIILEENKVYINLSEKEIINSNIFETGQFTKSSVMQ